MVDGKKVANPREQELIAVMKAKRETGESLARIHRWLNKEQGVKLAYSSMRMALK